MSARNPPLTKLLCPAIVAAVAVLATGSANGTIYPKVSLGEHLNPYIKEAK